MQILFLATWYPYPADNGSKIRVYHLLRALAQQHSVTLAAFAFGTAEPANHDQLPFCESVHTVAHNPFLSSRLYHAFRFFSPQPIVDLPVAAMRQLVNKLLATQEFDLIIASNTTMATYARQAPHIPAVLEEHNSVSRWLAENVTGAATALRRGRAWLVWRKQCAYERRLARHVNLFTMVSEADTAVTRQLLSGLATPVATVPNGVDCTYNQFGQTARTPATLVFNGSLTYSVNLASIRYFLDTIFPLIRQQIPETTLTITGSTEGVDLASLPASDNLIFTGFLPDLRPLMHRCSVCVAPLLEGGGTRLKILEAMALGTAVVSTRKGAEGLQVVDGRHLCLADEPAVFAQAVVNLLQDADLCAELTQHARELVETHYDWQQIGTQFTALVEEVAGTPSAEKSR